MDARMGGDHAPLPRSFWVSAVVLLLLLLVSILYIMFGYKSRLERGRRWDLNPMGEILRQPRGGAFAIFYRGLDFQVPFRMRLMEMPFSYRTEYELGGTEFPFENVSARFSARLVVPRDGIYTFHVDANDNARIWINNQLIFDKENTISIIDPAGELALKRGVVPLYAEWSNAEGNGWLGIWWEGPDMPRQFIPADLLIPDVGGRPAQ